MSLLISTDTFSRSNSSAHLSLPNSQHLMLIETVPGCVSMISFHKSPIYNVLSFMIKRTRLCPFLPISSAWTQGYPSLLPANLGRARSQQDLSPTLNSFLLRLLLLVSPPQPPCSLGPDQTLQDPTPWQRLAVHLAALHFPLTPGPRGPLLWYGLSLPPWE